MSEPARERAITRADVPFLVASLAAGALLLYLGRSLTFWYDEWRSITFDGTAFDFLRPVNEHWSTLPLLLYRATFDVVELRSYLPYLAEVIVVHLVAVAGAYALMRRRVGRFGATVLSIPLLVLGAGAENLYWAFQTGFVGSVAFGVWALVLVEMGSRRAVVASSVLLVGSLMSSGIGLFFVAAVAGRTLAERELRSRVLVAVPPAVVYLVWHFTLGREAVGHAGDLAGPISIADFVFRGVGFSVEAIVGLDRLPTGRVVGVAVVAVLAAIALRRALRGERSGLALGCLLGLVAMYALIGVARAALDFDYSDRGRYVYVAAFFLAACVADLLGGKNAFARPSRRRAAVGAAAAGVFLAWVIAVNVNWLFIVRTQFQYQADLTRAVVDLAVEHEGEPWLDPDAGLDLMPTAGELPALVARHGSPLEDAYFPSVVKRPSQKAYGDARRYLANPH